MGNKQSSKKRFKKKVEEMEIKQEIPINTQNQIKRDIEEQKEQKYAESSEETTLKHESVLNLVIYNDLIKQAKILENVSYEMKISDLKLEIEKLFDVEPKRQELNIFVDECGETKRKQCIQDNNNGSKTIQDYREQLQMNEVNAAIIDLCIYQSHDQVIKGLMYNEFINLLFQTIGKTEQFPLEICLLIASWIYGAGKLKTNVCIKFGDAIYGAEHDTMGQEIYEYFDVCNGMKIINKYNYKKLYRNLCVGEQEIFLKSSRDIMGGIINVMTIYDNTTKKYDLDDDYKRYDIISQCMLTLCCKSENNSENDPDLSLEAKHIFMKDGYQMYSTFYYDEDRRHNLLQSYFKYNQKIFIHSTKLNTSLLELIAFSLTNRNISKNNEKSLKPFINYWMSNDVVLNKQDIITFIYHLAGIDRFLLIITNNFEKYELIQEKLLIFIIKQLFCYPQIMKKFCTRNGYFNFLNLWSKAVEMNIYYQSMQTSKPKNSETFRDYDEELTEYGLLLYNTLIFRTFIYWNKNNSQQIIDWIDVHNIFELLFKWFQQRANWSSGFEVVLTSIYAKHNRDQHRIQTFHNNNFLMHNILQYLFQFYVGHKFRDKITETFDAVKFNLFHNHISNLLLSKYNQFGMLFSLSIGNNIKMKSIDGKIRDCFISINNKILRKVRRNWKKHNYECQYIYCKKTWKFLKSLKQSFKICKQCELVVYCDRKCQKKDWNIRHRNECKSLC